MRFSLASTLVVALAADVALASTWLSKAAYNKWHETELERWLSDHNIPYPTPADRKDLENLVKDNWNGYVVQPYNNWDASQLYSWLNVRGHEVKKGAEKNKDGLVAQVQNYWTETADSANSAYGDTKDWIFGSWSDSQLKAFLDRHGIPNPQPHTRDTLLSRARENYQNVANKLGETAHYPGNWLYESWSDSDLKAWADERGIPVPQPSNRDKLIANVRRNSRTASNQFAKYSSSVAASAASATQSLSNALLDSWSDSQIKEWCDKNGIKVPQGSKRNELVALARRNWAKVYGDTVASSASSVYGAATSSAGNQYAQATEGASHYGNQLYNQAFEYFNWATNMIGLGASSASKSATSATNVAGSSARSATNVAGASAKSASSAASASAKSASSAASASAKSAASSLSSAASSASVSASKSAVSAGKKDAKKIGDAAAESATKGKHRAQEAWQSATDYVKEEL